MDVYGRGPLGVVFLVYIHVVVFTFYKRFWGAVNLNPCLAWDDVVLAELGVIYHNLQLVSAFAAVYGNFYLQVMVLVSDVGDFYVLPTELLSNFFAVIDAVLEETAALDLPAVVNAATSGKACAEHCAQDACSNNG